MDNNLKKNINIYFEYVFCKDLMPSFIIPNHIDHMILQKLQLEEIKFKSNPTNKLEDNINKIKNSESYKFMTHRKVMDDNYINLFKKKIVIVLGNFKEEGEKMELIKEIAILIKSNYNFDVLSIQQIDKINEYLCINFGNKLYEFYFEDTEKFKLRNKFLKLLKLMKKLT